MLWNHSREYSTVFQIQLSAAVVVERRRRRRRRVVGLPMLRRRRGLICINAEPGQNGRYRVETEPATERERE